MKAYDHDAIDRAATEIVETAQRTGATVSGPVPLPTSKNVYCVIRSPFKDKDSREHFEIRTHKRLDRHQRPDPEDDRRAAADREPARRRRRGDPPLGLNAMPAILGKKIGMTQLFTEDGESVPVTVVEAAPNRVTAVRTEDDRRLRRGPARLGRGRGAQADQGRASAISRRPTPRRSAGWSSSATSRARSSSAARSPWPSSSPASGSRSRPSRSARASRARSSATTSAVDRSATAPTTSALPARSAPAPTRPASSRVARCRAAWAASGSPRRASRSSASTPRSNLLMLRGSVPGPKNGTVEVRTDG